jgi:cobalt-zinc-cadmium efflux system membrane fusion protein
MTRPTSRAVLTWLSLTGVWACGSEPPVRQSGQAPPAIEETHEEEANAIHLSEDVVRDLRISTSTVGERTGVQEVSALGEVTADQTRYAEVAPPIAGQIVRVLADSNDAVSPGDPLAELRSTDLGRARADLRAAVARRDLARQTLDRRRTLADERIVPLREVQASEAAYRAAEAEAAAAQATITAFGITPGEAADEGSLFLVRSPIGGRVIDRDAVLGQFAEPASALFIVADLSRVWIIAQAFERDAVNVRPESLAHVTLAALPGQAFDGRVVSIGRRVDPGARTVPIRIAVANPTLVMRPGMSASASLEVGGEGRTILTVPAAAIQRVGDRWLAFVPKAEYEYEMRPVGRGRDLGSDIEITSGLAAGETVVVEGAFLLKAEAEKRSGGGDQHAH